MRRAIRERSSPAIWRGCGEKQSACWTTCERGRAQSEQRRNNGGGGVQRERERHEGEGTSGHAKSAGSPWREETRPWLSCFRSGSDGKDRGSIGGGVMAEAGRITSHVICVERDTLFFCRSRVRLQTQRAKR